MGFVKNKCSEEKPENPEKAETVPTDDKYITDTASETAQTNSKACILTALTTILEETESPEEEWPKEVLQKVLARFGQMPRTNRNLVLSVYCSKFNVDISLDVSKRKH